MFIKIIISSSELKKEILVKDKKFYVNMVQKNIDIENFVSRLFCIISSWEEQMIGVRTTDEYIYSIEVVNNGENVKLIGINKFPYNFNEFIKLINEVIV